MRGLRLTISLAMICAIASPAMADWRIDLVDNSGSVGYESSIDYDSNGYPHIAYYNDTNDTLKYARWTGTTWAVEPVESTGYYRYCALILDSLDRPYIAAASTYSATTYPLRLYSKVGGVWTPEAVASNANLATGQRLSLVLVGTTPHLAYYSTSGTLVYTFKSGASWVPEVVDGAGGVNVGQYPSMAISNSGKVHIAYFDQGAGDLKFAYRSLAGAWTVLPPVDGATANVGAYCSLVLDNSGVAHISYYDDTNNDLKMVHISNLP